MDYTFTGIWWSLCFPCAHYCRAADEAAEAKEVEDEREASRRSREKWEAMSENLCWACSCHFFPRLESKPGRIIQAFGDLNEIVERAKRCH
jgi:hypothetical protein